MIERFLLIPLRNYLLRIIIKRAPEHQLKALLEDAAIQ